jgi:N-6 DNA Methylase
MGCSVGMDRGASEVRGTDTAVHGASQTVRATAPFQRYLESLRWSSKLDPNDALTAALPSSVRRKAGAFFTSAELADALVTPFAADFKGGVRVVDPTCGAGDLLLAAARQFKHARDPEKRLEEWERKIFGRDLFEAFVLSARLRMYRAAQPALNVPDLQRLFPGIRRGCSLKNTEAYESASHVLLNPPYTLVRAPADCEWRTGRVSSAALFMEVVAKNCEAGTRIGAVLPDVLRSGSGYEKWRTMLGRLIEIEQVQIVGRFARWADVDVFLLHGVVRKASPKTKTSWPSAERSADTLARHATISVGPVVDYRSPRQGPWRPYLTVDNAPAWETTRAGDLACRRFEGRTFRPPFVVVRRTSRAGDAHRMVGTIITGDRRVAVENHLLILRPSTRTVAECEALIARLKDPRTTAWLNERIRCRHLTIGSVNELPWWCL